MHVLFLFLDGIGLGADNADTNPFARADMPNLQALLAGRRLLRSAAPYDGERATLLALDAGLGVDGLPQSATGQGVLLTGINIPAELGYHYGPKPNPEVAAFLTNTTLFARTVNAGKRAALLNAYPPRYFAGIDSGKRLYSSIPLALTNAGLHLFTHDDYVAGRALSADFTGEGWRSFLGIPDAPAYEAYAAGLRLAALALNYEFAFFEYWASDYAGHHQDMDSAVQQLETFDGVLKGLLEGWPASDALILLTSDHGNMEDLSTRKHTDAAVPLLLFGDHSLRARFANGLHDLADVAPAIARLLEL